MNSLEIRAIAYVCAAVLFMVLGLKAGMHHVQAQWNVDKLAQAAVVEKAQADIITLRTERDKLQATVEQDHVQLVASGNALVGDISGSLRKLADQIRSGALSAAMGNSGGSTGTGSSSGSAGDIAAAIERVNAAIDDVNHKCVHDSAELTGILALAPKVTH